MKLVGQQRHLMLRTGSSWRPARDGQLAKQATRARYLADAGRIGTETRCTSVPISRLVAPHGPYRACIPHRLVTTDQHPLATRQIPHRKEPDFHRFDDAQGMQRFRVGHRRRVEHNEAIIVDTEGRSCSVMMKGMTSLPVPIRGEGRILRSLVRTDTRSGSI